MESRDIAQMGLVSKEIVQFCFSLVCYALFGLDEVSVIALSTSSELVQRSCNSVLLLFNSNI